MSSEVCVSTFDKWIIAWGEQNPDMKSTSVYLAWDAAKQYALGRSEGLPPTAPAQADADVDVANGQEAKNG